MAKSIIQPEKDCCFLCGKNAHADYFGLEEHHIYGAANRKLSEKYGLKVYLCHSCHNEPPFGVHHYRGNRLRLQKQVQRIAMEHYGWTIQDFIRIFGKNYL